MIKMLKLQNTFPESKFDNSVHNRFRMIVFAFIDRKI